MPNQAKIEWVEELTETIEQSPDLVFADFKGLTVESMETLRQELYENDSRFQVVKNRLAQRAFENALSREESSAAETSADEDSSSDSNQDLPEVGDLPGVGPAKVEALSEEGFDSVEQIASAELDDLTNVSGIGDSMAKKILNAANQAIPESKPNSEAETSEGSTSGGEVDDLMEELDRILTGNTGIAFAPEGLVNPAKVMMEFSEEHEELVIKGGMLEGSLLDVEGVEQISKLPTREELLTKLATSLNSPIQALATFLNYPLQSLVNSLEQIKDQKEEE